MEKSPNVAHQKRKSDPNTIFVGGFSSQTKQSELKALFSQFGQVKKINMVRNKRGGSKGYCFLQFRDISGAENALQQGDIEYNGRNLSCRPILSGQELEHFKKNNDDKRIVVTNLPEYLDEYLEKDLRRLFNRFGKITNFYFVKEIEGRPEKLNTLMLTYKSKFQAENVQNARIVYDNKSLKIISFAAFKAQNEARIEEGHSPERNSANQIDSRIVKINKERELILRWKKLKVRDLILMISFENKNNPENDNFRYNFTDSDIKHSIVKSNFNRFFESFDRRNKNYCEENNFKFYEGDEKLYSLWNQ